MASYTTPWGTTQDVGHYNLRMPKFIPPCIPIPAKKVPAGEAWVHEVKFDGYRVQLHKAGRDVVIYSRNGHGFTDRFTTIAMLLRELPAKTAVASDARSSCAL
jgi:bifunctional non-homologous end joining protein LigD